MKKIVAVISIIAILWILSQIPIEYPVPDTKGKLTFISQPWRPLEQFDKYRDLYILHIYRQGNTIYTNTETK